MNLRQRIEQGFEKFGHALAKRRLILIPLIVALAASLSSQAPRITLDTSTESMLRGDDDAKIFYDDFRNRFGRDEVIVASIQSSDTLAPEFLARLKDFHAALEEETPHLEEVRSLINARVTRGDNDELLVEDLLEEWPRSPDEWMRLRKFVLNNPFYRNLLISPDARLTTVMIETSAYSSQDPNIESALEGFEESEPCFLDRRREQ